MNITNFDDWIPSQRFSDGSGRSEKIWLENKIRPNDIGLFKYPKTRKTYEHISEHLSSILASKLNILCCKTDIGTYNNRMGTMSYLVHDINTEVFVEGLSLIGVIYPFYDEQKLKVSNSDDIYSLELIQRCLKAVAPIILKDFVKMTIFDFFIGNSDRHHSNWAFIIKPGGEPFLRFSPLYDNGSSLCAYVPEEDIANYFKDKLRFQSLIDTKSRSIIGINNIRRPTHKQFISEINNRGLLDKEYINSTYFNLSSRVLKDIISNEYNEVISDNRKRLLVEFLMGKLNILNQIIK